MPDALDGFTPIISDEALVRLDAAIQTLDPAVADRVFTACRQAAAEAQSAKEFISVVTHIIGTVLPLAAAL